MENKTIIIQSINYFFFNDTATTEIYTLSLHDALPILSVTEKLMDELAQCYNVLPQLDINIKLGEHIVAF